jgi:hypothetical protein
MPTITDPSIAPEGHEGFYVLSPVPVLAKNLGGVDWEKMAIPYRDRILQFLEDNYLPELAGEHRCLASHRPAALQERAQQLSRRGVLGAPQPDAICLAASAQPLGGIPQPVFCRRGNPPRRGRTRCSGVGKDRCQLDPG